MLKTSFGHYTGALLMITVYGSGFYFGLWLALDFAFKWRGLGGSALAFIALYHFAYAVAKTIRSGV
jgi:hypothetical protein